MANHAKEREGKLKYILIFIIIIAILAIGIYFIINRGNDTEMTSIKTTSSKEKTIEDFRKKLEENGLVITNTIQKSSTMIGAVEGIGYEINSSVIEIYKFDENSTEELSRNNIKSAKSTGIVSMPSFNNITLNVKYNNGLCLVNYENHPDKEKIIEIFNKL